MHSIILLSGFLRFINGVKGFIWDYILIYLLLGVGIYFTVRLGFPQFTKLAASFKHAFGGVFVKEEGGVSSFQALATAVAAQIGTGNIGGVATAIVAGGPGAVFWMWVSGILGMGTVFGEAVLAQRFKETDKDGEVFGGPAYYLSKGLKNKKAGKILAAIFAVMIIIALGLIGNMVQSNSIGSAMKSSFNIPEIVTGVIVAILAALIFIGGIERISKMAQMVVPVMAVAYFIASFVIMIKFRSNIVPVFASIFENAFTAKAAVGGAAGVAVKEAVKLGLARGLFSNEAGMGSTPHAHAVAKVDYPAQQGFTAIGGVFVDTIIVCTATALSILLTDAHNVAPELNGVNLTQKGYEIAFGKSGTIFLGVSLLFFAFTTIVGWYYFGESNIRYLFGEKALLPYRLSVVVFIILGAKFEIDTVWSLADVFNGLMVIPNVIGLLILSPLVFESMGEYKKLPKSERFSDCE